MTPALWRRIVAVMGMLLAGAAVASPNFEQFPLNVAVFRAINNVRHPALDALFTGITTVEIGWLLIPVLGVLLIARSPRWKWLLLAVALETLIVTLLKQFAYQPRPATLLEHVYLLRPLYHGSFPSGDTAFIAAVATAAGWGARRSAQLVWVLAVLLIAYERIYIGVHFPLDVTAGAVVGITSGALAYAIFHCDVLCELDIRLLAWVQRRRTRFSDMLSQIVKPLGDGRYTLPPLLALALYGHLAHHDAVRLTALLAVASFALTGAVAQLLQQLCHRQRPSTGCRPDCWDGPRRTSRGRSFPSGHASASMSVLAVIGLRHLDLPWLAALAFGLAALTAYSRLNDNAHWPSDVLIGCWLGIMSACVVIAII